MSLRPDPFTHYTILNEHALCSHVFCVRTLLVNTPFYLGVCMCRSMITYAFACGDRWRGERKGRTATVLTSVQSGTWPLAVGAAGRWRWFGSKGRACSSTFFYLRLYFSPFRRDTVFVLQRASSRRTKGEMRKCAETLTSLFWNVLISVDRLALEREEKARAIENKWPQYGRYAATVRECRRDMYDLQDITNMKSRVNKYRNE